jgi:hypothetical protein
MALTGIEPTKATLANAIVVLLWLSINLKLLAEIIKYKCYFSNICPINRKVNRFG